MKDLLKNKGLLIFGGIVVLMVIGNWVGL